ncbi:malectin [Apis florea]|uniref:Malectin n=2 Tax=Apis TaxID=7459 RepID=A0A7M7LN38_APIME|nr:malectin [Apis florea]XP_006563359.1 malectin [Apis mellifera]XP_016907455.1 malectin [Apis cerana]XP_026302126.1 malectin [Apis mellifera]XP_031776282.1 malectin [Apis florea]KAG6804073.1 malectin [Apis mellifera caucasica]KAG9437093.1 malectin [Apis mellifera carnica]PBC30722.1 Malectin [Apis cerana cerana]|eukprot:XP_006563359.1 malectin [Apis mellifera]
MTARWEIYFLTISMLLFTVCVQSLQSLEVIYAINAGGDTHTDSYGIRYTRDPLMNKVGTASDYGKQLIIGRVNTIDQILYQTERYHHSTFGYDIPINEDGDYVMILKFCEVYFNSPNMKVFDVVLNGDHTVVTDLDIFERVGRGIAHDEYISFKVQAGKLIYNDEESDILAGKIRVEFIKGYRDNPKINAIAVVKGNIEDIPQLGPIPQEPEEYHNIQEDEEESTVRSRHTSGPRTPDPYSIDDSSVMLPVFVALGAFIPLLFCLCKL